MQLRVYLVTATAVKTSDREEQAGPNFVKTIRRACQNKINKCLWVVQQEVTCLTSDLSSEDGGQENEGCLLSVRWHRVSTQSNQEVGEKEEMSMTVMREQLSVMKEQIGYLEEQQQAQGLSSQRSSGLNVIPLS